MFFKKPFCVLSVLLLSSPVYAANLRPSGVLHNQSVYLSDLFSGLQKGQDRLLGPAPDPGKSIHIGSAQLIALADQYNVDWDNQSSQSQVTLTRSGKTLSNEDFEHIVQKYVSDNNLSDGNPHIAVTITHSDPVTISDEPNYEVTLSNFNWDKRTNHFKGDLFEKDNPHPVGMLLGDIHIAHSVEVFSQSFSSGHIIKEGDVHVNDAYKGTVTQSMNDAPDIEQLTGMALTHSVSKDQAAQKNDFRAAILVHRGDPALIVYQAPGIRLTATGRVVEDGGVGQYIHVINQGNHMILIGRVAGSGEIIVDASSTAISPDSDEAKKLGIQNLNLK